MFDSFDIKHISDNSIVDINEVDKKVCEHFHLEYNDDDYGHFFFTLAEDEKEFYSHFQKSISWVGLLHTIIFYLKDLDYGKKSKYELLGALVILRKRYIHFPKCTEQFIVDLIEFLQNQDLYVHVNYKKGEK